MGMHYPSIQIRLPLEKVEQQSGELITRKDLIGRAKYLSALIDLLDWWHNGVTDLKVETSGTTGFPKTMHFTREAAMASARASLHSVPIQPGHQVLLAMDLRYVGAKMLVIRSLISGASLTVVPPSSNPFFERDLGIFNYSAFVPFQISQILNDQVSTERLEKLETILIGGGDLQPRDEEILLNLKPEFIHTYGMSETLSHVAIRRLKARSNFFTMLEGYSFEIESEGRLSITTPFIKEKIRTNDLAERISDKNFHWLGRADLMINSGGIKLFPDQIESKVRKVVQEIPGVEDFILTGMADPKFGEKMIMLMQCKQNLKPEKQAILEQIRTLVGRYEAPKEIHFIDSLERNENGKIDRAKTTMLFLKGR